MYYQTTYDSPFGKMTIACDGEEKHIVGLWFAGQKYFLGTLSETPALKEGVPVLERAKDWLDAYFAGKKPVIAGLPLAPAGSIFRQEVWKMLCEIPCRKMG